MRESITVLLGAAALLVLSGCGESPAVSAVEDSPVRLVSQPVSQDEAHDRAVDEVEDKTFEDVGDTSLCTEDCSGHEAGFAWARDQGVTSTSDCGGDSQSFVEGCEAFAEAVEAREQEIVDEDDDEQE